MLSFFYISSETVFYGFPISLFSALWMARMRSQTLTEKLSSLRLADLLKMVEVRLLALIFNFITFLSSLFSGLFSSIFFLCCFIWYCLINIILLCWIKLCDSHHHLTITITIMTITMTITTTVSYKALKWMWRRNLWSRVPLKPSSSHRVSTARTCAHSYIFTHTHTYMHTYMCTFLHPFTHTHTYIQCSYIIYS